MCHLLLLFALASLAFAPAPLPRRDRPGPKKGDLEAMAGVWSRVSLKINRSASGGGASVEVRGGRMVFPGGSEWDVTLDPSASPKRIKAVGTAGDVRGVIMEGVYKLEKDRLSVSWRQTYGGQGPVESFDENGKGVWRYEFQRRR